MSTTGRISIDEIAKRLTVGRRTVYQMLEHKIIPAIRFGKRWIVTLKAFEEWERKCGREDPDVTLNRIL
jgi:excisionase family DNA binding protein